LGIRVSEGVQGKVKDQKSPKSEDESSKNAKGERRKKT
jgi:hypothetical protein